MAISNILSQKIIRSRTRQQPMAERHDYDQKPGNTKDDAASRPSGTLSCTGLSSPSSRERSLEKG